MKDLLLDFLLFLVIVAIIATVIMAGAEIKNAPVQEYAYATRYAYSTNFFANWRREWVWKQIKKGIDNSGYAREIDINLVYAMKYFSTGDRLCIICRRSPFAMSRDTWISVIKGYDLDPLDYRYGSIRDSAEIVSRYIVGYCSVYKDIDSKQFSQLMDNYSYPYNDIWSDKEWIEIYSLSEYLPYLE
jgi:hypothetical protein